MKSRTIASSSTIRILCFTGNPTRLIWYLDHKSCAPVGPVLSRNPASVKFCYFLYSRQPQSGALGPGGKKWREQLLERFLGNAWAIVINYQTKFIIARSLECQPDISAIGFGLHGVLYQVKYNHPEKLGVKIGLELSRPGTDMDIVGPALLDRPEIGDCFLDNGY